MQLGLKNKNSDCHYFHFLTESFQFQLFLDCTFAITFVCLLSFLEMLPEELHFHVSHLSEMWTTFLTKNHHKKNIDVFSVLYGLELCKKYLVSLLHLSEYLKLRDQKSKPSKYGPTEGC